MQVATLIKNEAHTNNLEQALNCKTCREEWIKPFHKPIFRRHIFKVCVIFDTQEYRIEDNQEDYKLIESFVGDDPDHFLAETVVLGEAE